MLTCRECGQSLKRVTNTHLLRCSKMTMQEYSIKYNVPMSEMIMQEVIDSRSKPEPLSNEAIVARIDKHPEPTQEQYEILIGSLLGDAWIHRAKTYQNSSYLTIQHGIKQLDYLLWKGLKLSSLGAKFYQYYNYSSVSDRYVTRNEIRTKANVHIGSLSKVFYKEGEGHKRIQDFSIIQKYMTPLALAIWYMDDGTYCELNSVCELCTQSFTSEEVDILIKILFETFAIRGIKKDIGDQYSIRFYADERRKLFGLILPYIIPSMIYKITGKVVNSPIMTICKKVEFDSAHFLEDHPAKCFNLHGGRYNLDVYIRGEINPLTGMVVDYGYLKKVVKQYIVDKFDHHFINGQEGTLSWRSTTELIVMYTWFVLVEFLPGLHKLRLWETPDSFCEFEGPSHKELKSTDRTHPYYEFLESFRNPVGLPNRIIGKIDEIFDEELFDSSPTAGVSFGFDKEDE
jgi:6-pyruvoyl tetrahydropterin synthase/QueD family protein